MAATKQLDIEKIRADGGTQTRAELRIDTIEEYAESMRTGAVFPPIDVFVDSKGNHWLADGFHRYQAGCRAEVSHLLATIHKGELRDAIWFALSANSKNGLQRTNLDKRRAVEMALADGAWKELNDDALAKHIGVHQTFVNRVRNELKTVVSSTGEPVKRIGKDGKRRPATNKKRTKPARSEAVSPQQAEEWLDGDDGNRELDGDAVERFAAIERFRSTLALLEKQSIEAGIDCDKEIAAIRMKLMKVAA